MRIDALSDNVELRCHYRNLKRAAGITVELVMEFESLHSLKTYFGLPSWAEIERVTTEKLLEEYEEGRAKVYV